MTLFLVLAAVGLIGLVAWALALTTLAHSGETRPESTGAARTALAPSRFFVREAPRPAARPRVPIEALLLEIERHVRLEQAAAEAFLETPTAQLLHSRTMSSFH
jgi:hypothetical protein